MLKIQVALCAPFPVLRAKETGSAVCKRCRECDGRYRARRDHLTLEYMLSFPMGYPEGRPGAPHVALTTFSPVKRELAHRSSDAGLQLRCWPRE